VLRVEVAWGDVARNETSYLVERSALDLDGLPVGWELLAVLPRNAEAWTDWEPLWGVVAVYRVAAVNRCGEGAAYAVVEPSATGGVP
jgi:hypothetical protein